MILEIFKYPKNYETDKVKRISLEIKDEELQKEFLFQMHQIGVDGKIIHKDDNIMVFVH